MLGLAYGAGLRRSEVVSLDKADYHREFMYVTGKGKTERKIYLPEQTTKLIERFLLSIDDCSVLFPRMYSGGKTKNQRLRSDALIKIINIRCDNTKIKRFTPHDLRRSFATNLINSDVDLFTVQELMRHKALETTQRYDMRNEEVKKEAIKKLPF
jgi:integrase